MVFSGASTCRAAPANYDGDRVTLWALATAARQRSPAYLLAPTLMRLDVRQQAQLKAGARAERTLEAVAWMPWSGA
jgi:hypothetical protein